MFVETKAPLSPAGGNIPGICEVFAVPKEGITAMYDLNQILITGDYPMDGSTLVISELYAICANYGVSMQLAETEKDTVQGKVFTYKLTFDINNDDYATRGKIIQAYDRREWILVISERSGPSRVLGSLARGADFSAQLNTGSVMKGENMFACGFTWQSGERSFYHTTG